MNLPPEVNALVRLDVGPAEALYVSGAPSRVEDREDDAAGARLLVGAPTFDGDVDAVPGSRVLVRWADRRGLRVLVSHIEEVRRSGGTRWLLRVEGDVMVLQRRQYARAAVPGRVAVVPRHDTLTSVVTGRVLDLSEGGARLVLETCVPLEPGGAIEVHLSLDDFEAVLVGTVIRVDPGRDGRGEAAVAFDEPVAVADEIRRAVLRQQLLERRTASQQ